MSSIEDIKAKAQELSDVIGSFQVAATIDVPVAEVAKVEAEVAALDAELKADVTPTV